MAIVSVNSINVMLAQVWNPGSGWVGNNDGPSSLSRHSHHLHNLSLQAQLFTNATITAMPELSLHRLFNFCAKPLPYRISGPVIAK